MEGPIPQESKQLLKGAPHGFLKKISHVKHSVNCLCKASFVLLPIASAQDLCHRHAGVIADRSETSGCQSCWRRSRSSNHCGSSRLPWGWPGPLTGASARHTISSQALHSQPPAFRTLWPNIRSPFDQVKVTGQANGGQMSQKCSGGIPHSYEEVINARCSGHSPSKQKGFQNACHLDACASSSVKLLQHHWLCNRPKFGPPFLPDEIAHLTQVLWKRLQLRVGTHSSFGIIVEPLDFRNRGLGVPNGVFDAPVTAPEVLYLSADASRHVAPRMAKGRQLPISQGGINPIHLFEGRTAGMPFLEAWLSKVRTQYDWGIWLHIGTFPHDAIVNIFGELLYVRTWQRTESRTWLPEPVQINHIVRKSSV
mmetsp:Transcript_62288/g.148704  ORF Transcript_62288/g.148704 Transcript_62288/m.148704 type:complete len:367 (-) Transcript_62288:1538-2638(-)